jgi:hypothetical protein
MLLFLMLQTRPWLMYKVEKVVNGDLFCERCNLDPDGSYINLLHLKLSFQQWM